ncbi:MAG: hypothetical protein J3Q66DRAFT_352321 [Benniella sp.]|nr:MAG: hypothetical protein J3Q66DRAFT_352321 [Benniella sp.]
MLSLTPLEIPEIVLCVASHVPKRCLIACVQVSKVWYRVFVPFLWKDIELSSRRPITPETMCNYRQFVKALRIDCSLMRERFPPSLPNLVSLAINYPLSEEDIFELVTRHPSLTHLGLTRTILPLSTQLLDRLNGFSNLKSLELNVLRVSESNIDMFWQLCTRLESLEVDTLRLGTKDSPSSLEFPHLRKLRVGYSFGLDIPLMLGFMQKCPNLQSFQWNMDFEGNHSFTPQFAQLISEGSWQHLQSVSTGILNDDEDLSAIIGSMQRITALETQFPLFTPAIMDLLRPHFSHLQTLDLHGAIGLTSEMVQEVMCSCPSLTTFKGSIIEATDIVEGRPWVCLRLKGLDLSFRFSHSTINRKQPLVLDQLSRLTRLEEMRVYSGRKEKKSQKALDLRLERGLGKLSTLRLLRVLDFDSAIQRMGEQEVDWMLKHWKSLDRIYGRLNTMEPGVHQALTERLRVHGVEVKDGAES